jgi:peptidyl-prolyl cis-trans isomerase SurA
MSSFLLYQMRRLLFAGLGIVFFLAPAAADVVDRIVAVVNDEVISYSELEQMAKAFQAQPGVSLPPGGSRDLQKQLLESLINQKLAKSEAKRRGLTVSDAEVNKAFDEFKKRNSLEDEKLLTQVLAKSGMTIKDMKQQISEQLTSERLMTVMVSSKVAVSDSEVRSFYEREFPKTGGAQISLKMLNLPYPPGVTEAQKEEVRKKAEMILEEYKKGTSWEQLRERHSLLVQDLGFVALADLDPKLAQILTGAKTGEIIPVQTLQGFQLVQMVSRRDGQARSFEEVAPNIRRVLQRREMEKHFNEWIKGQRDRAHIKIMM